MRKLKFFLPLLLALCITFTAAAQTDCPAIVKAALEAIDASCSATSRNQVCYGNITLNATPREGVNDLTFDKAGDLASVTDIQSLQLSSMSATDSSWGIALMELQANLPDTLPGQNVTFLLFGDVQIANGATAASLVSVTFTTTGNANVRIHPTTSGNNIISSLKKGETVVATGRLADSSWVQIKIGDTHDSGWVSAALLEGDMSSLSVIKPNEPTWGPMQSFYFTTGVRDRPCDQAPDSGILIQTPKGAGRITLEANDVEITLGSTVYLQAQPNDFLTATVLEGEATLTSGGQTQAVPAGTYSRVHLDTKGRATGLPSFPKPYNKSVLETLPLSITAFAPITIADPLTTDQITTDIQTTSITDTPGGSNMQPSGSWYQVNLVNVKACPGDPPSWPSGTFNRSWDSTLTFSEDRKTLSFFGGELLTQTLSRISDNVYRGVDVPGDPGATITITFTSPITYTISKRSSFYNGICWYNYEGNGVYAG